MFCCFLVYECLNNKDNDSSENDFDYDNGNDGC